MIPWRISTKNGVGALATTSRAYTYYDRRTMSANTEHKQFAIIVRREGGVTNIISHRRCRGLSTTNEVSNGSTPQRTLENRLPQARCRDQSNLVS
jgi:hypothetical protein